MKRKDKQINCWRSYMYIDTCIVTTDRHTFKIWRNKLMKSKDKQINVWRRYMYVILLFG